MNRSTLILTSLTLASGAASAGTFSMDFTNPGDVVLSSSQAPGAWYTDRYAPGVFESGVMFDGDYRLHQGIRSDGNQANRPTSQNGDFYNYQGRKYDVNSPSGTTISIDLFVDSAWNDGVRAGMWTTMSNGNLTYPIIEYVVAGDNGDGNAYTGFRWWQSGLGWSSTSFENAATDEWYTLEIELTATDVLFSINGTSIGSVDNQGAHMIDNVILNAHNQGIAGEYDVYWDNFGGVPSPGAASLLAMGGLIGTRRRR